MIFCVCSQQYIIYALGCCVWSQLLAVYSQLSVVSFLMSVVLTHMSIMTVFWRSVVPSVPICSRTIMYEVLGGSYPYSGFPPESVIWSVCSGHRQNLANVNWTLPLKVPLLVGVLSLSVSS